MSGLVARDLAVGRRGAAVLSGVSLSRSSGFDDFDRYMVDLVRRASPVPPPPPGISGRVTVPLGYRNC